MAKQTNQSADTSSSIATIAYITLMGLIIAFVMNKDKKEAFANFHIRQSLGLTLTGLALGIISLIPIIGWIIYIVGIFVLLYMWFMGLMNAINKKEQSVPFIGEKFNEWFKNI
ncbi:MAG: hypothetical protein COZ75_10905 [Flavobacteriaceae bacterium CG_4_8_14_3_um_filter_34_10]|nr:hypothetical protein [Flavobacteriia bacterium]PIQ19394.1 MAG: hypothetical protein COW66_01395 [Flavobacteriaceae bacterium CG18_big_fil_WC_8_21_14_2_50_34_36]PIV49910.1 MAG: hypothetical protein COS19_06210 [Flavobacteriaceae bacterium CG02_land_8_20_14_3_00_34_13]PIX08665.1 MAG: hypothetical protein COZ75_10905 [Flavobacteriaceae bacterium CG_4_8_14_3_um_filter_34_10]PIZ08024.1 MAG: hypothetical protein COY56_06065 [Flavobacteriaceae bacterium CG_4_10_14_0_8_um_filter_34_31]PJC06026.1 MA